MGKPTVPDLKELFKQAAEIAQQVPEAMQAAAFNRAVDLLTGTPPAMPGTQTPLPSPGRRGAARQAAQPTPPPADDSIGMLMDQIDSTQHPGIRSTSTVLDRALMVLQIARTDHGVDGLVPSDIARILTDKFRVSTTDVAVRMALGKATNLVNRVQRGNAFIYRIMGPGEEYLAHLKEGKDVAAPMKPRKSRKRARATEQLDTAAPHTATASSPRKPNAPRAKASGLGPKAAVLELVESGFFSTGKTGPQVQEHLKKKRGYDIGTDSLRFAMLRLVRDKVLEREHNADGQYEYKRP